MRKFYLSFIVIGVLFLTLAGTALANHSWNNYHWSRSSNPFTVKLGDNLTSNWDSYLATASSDWSTSTVLDTSIVPGQSNPKTCKPVAGRVEVCNSAYGKNGWLGIASVWVNGEHITQGTVKMNDTYYKTPAYNTPAWRNLVLCQEIGHTFGLDHQDENFTNANLGTCMDYTNNPVTNQHPNLHDYEMLEQIYSHFDIASNLSSAQTSNGQEIDHNDPKAWGKLVSESSDKHTAIYELDLGKGKKVFTFVAWAEDRSSKNE